jgi:hypothetical protein
MGSIGVTIYRGKRSCGCENSSLSSSPTESKTHSGFLRIWFGFDYTTVSFLHSEVFKICVEAGSARARGARDGVIRRLSARGWLGLAGRGSGTHRVGEHWRRCFSGTRSHKPGIWPVRRPWAPAAGRAREQGGDQAGPAT